MIVIPLLSRIIVMLASTNHLILWVVVVMWIPVILTIQLVRVAVVLIIFPCREIVIEEPIMWLRQALNFNRESFFFPNQL